MLENVRGATGLGFLNQENEEVLKLEIFLLYGWSVNLLRFYRGCLELSNKNFIGKKFD